MAMPVDVPRLNHPVFEMLHLLLHRQQSKNEPSYGDSYMAHMWEIHLEDGEIQN